MTLAIAISPELVPVAAPPRARDLAALQIRMRAQLREVLGAAQAEAWFATLAIDTVEGDLALLSQPTKFLASWVRAHHHDALLAALATVDPAIRRYLMTVRTRDVAATKVEAPALAALPVVGPLVTPPPSSNPPQTSIDCGRLEPNAEFATFLRGPSNALARTAADMLAESMKAGRDRHDPLVLTGPTGVGKSHLAHAVAAAARSAGCTVALFDAWRLLTFLAEFQRRGGSDPITAIVALDGLVIDDLHLVRSASGAALVDQLLRRMLALRKMVVVTSSEALPDLERVDAEVRSRLAAGIVATIAPPEPPLRLALLERFVAEVGDPTFVVAPDVAVAIASAVDADARALRGAARLLHIHHCNGAALATPCEALALLGHLAGALPPAQPRIQAVIAAVANYYGIEPRDIISSRRTANVVRPRQIAMFLAKLLTLRSLPEIGRRFGGRDHTTVLHAVRKISGLAATDKDLRDDLSQLQAALEGRR